MKKAKKLLLAAVLFLSGIPVWITAWCCMPPDKHCEYTYTFDEKGNEKFVDENGKEAPKDKNGKCAKCHHDIEAHMCDEYGWPE